jgi:hypothetical protein
LAQSCRAAISSAWTVRGAINASLLNRMILGKADMTIRRALLDRWRTG